MDEHNNSGKCKEAIQNPQELNTNYYLMDK